MSDKIKDIVKEAAYNLSVEGLYVTDEETQKVIEVLEKKRSLESVIDFYKARGELLGRKYATI